ncbi:MAG: hypothetical protein CSB44_07995 [Gammaproteobacteria bacterium]|nr:MAG: hypothetical protein CSB44_07995 [Gammaproteobacteria bacterium]
MPKTTHHMFQHSIIAAAVISLSACSTTPRNDGMEPTGPVKVAANVARSTIDVSAWTIDKTVYMLGFSDNDPGRLSERNTHRAPTDESGTIVAGNDTNSPAETVVTQSVESADVRVIGSVSDETLMSTGQTTEAGNKVPALDPNVPAATQAAADSGADAGPPIAENAASSINRNIAWNDSIAVANGFEAIPGSDRQSPVPAMYEHKVGGSETLWDIAKATTGDATNWHIIADLNQLGPNATVFPGQSLEIPSDMLRPELRQANGTDVAAADTGAHTDATPTAVDTASDPTGKLVASNGPAALHENADSPLTGETLALARQNEAAAAHSMSAAATPVAPIDDAAMMNARSVPGKTFELGNRETLWDFAKRTTGDATNWQAIAVQNGWDDEQARKVFPGQRIDVPASLLKAELLDGDGKVAAEAPVNDTGDVSEPDAAAAMLRDSETAVESATDTLTGGVVIEPVADALPTDDSAADATAAVLAGSNNQEEIRIVEATYRSEDTVELPIETETDATDATAETTAATAPADADALTTITVSGTYYPKAVYNDADFSSSLLMRVSPGEELSVRRVDNGWYEVETGKGTGYMHERDIQ